jgi:hypothetical protein
MNRPKFSTTDLVKALDSLEQKIDYRLTQKGWNHLSSDFECMGILDQEIMEYREAIHKRLHNQARVEELLDIAWAALLGIMMHNAILNKDDDQPSSHLF